jgi:hypothetical protein
MRWLLKRWWFWAGTGFMLVAIAAGYLLIPVGDGRISQASCDAIQEGWSPEQVVDLLGKHSIPGTHPEPGRQVDIHCLWVGRDSLQLSQFSNRPPRFLAANTCFAKPV